MTSAMETSGRLLSGERCHVSCLKMERSTTAKLSSWKTTERATMEIAKEQAIKLVEGMRKEEERLREEINRRAREKKVNNM